MKRVKATFYVDPENLTALESERLSRIRRGVARSEAGVSDLVNEAIREAFGGPAERPEFECGTGLELERLRRRTKQGQRKAVRRRPARVGK